MEILPHAAIDAFDKIDKELEPFYKAVFKDTKDLTFMLGGQ